MQEHKQQLINDVKPTIEKLQTVIDNCKLFLVQFSSLDILGHQASDIDKWKSDLTNNGYEKMRLALAESEEGKAKIIQAFKDHSLPSPADMGYWINRLAQGGFETLTNEIQTSVNPANNKVAIEVPAEPNVQYQTQNTQQQDGRRRLLSVDTDFVQTAAASKTIPMWYVFPGIQRLWQLLPTVTSLLNVARFAFDVKFSDPHTQENSLAVVPANNQQNSNDVDHHMLFDSSDPKPLIQSHSETREPIFTYCVYKNGAKVGSVSFYGQPQFCHSKARDRHNIIATTGVLSQFEIDANSKFIQETCRVLPPTLWDTVTTNAEQGAKHGVLRGISNVVGYTSKAKQAFVYYGGYYLWRFQGCIAQQQDSNWESVLHATYQAAVDTGSIFAITTVVNQVCRAANWSSQCATKSGWSKTGGLFKFLGNHGSKSIYAYNAHQQGIANTAASFAAGSVAQFMVEKVGYAMTSRFFKPAPIAKQSAISALPRSSLGELRQFR